MGFTLVRRVLCGWGSALLVVLAAGSAQAAVYVGTWDPKYGFPFEGDGPDPFRDLGWRGSATFNVPAAPGCFSGGANLTACTPGASVLSGQVIFYATSADGSSSGADFAVVNWSTGNLTSVTVDKIRDNGSKPTQFDTGPFPYFIPQRTNFSSDYNAIWDSIELVAFSLEFWIDREYTEAAFFSGPVLNWLPTDDCDDCTGGRNDIRRFPPTNFRITLLVPEPASLALAALALLTLAVVTRRRTPPSAGPRGR